LADYELIKKIFDSGKGKHGFRVIQMKLNSSGVVMNHKKIIRIKNKYRLYTKIRKVNPYKMISKKTQEHRTLPNILQRQFIQDTPRKVICTDITYLKFRHSFLYISAAKDLATGEIVGWKTSHTLHLGFVLETLEQFKEDILTNITMIHSDQGTHYTSPIFIAKASKLGLVQSMSGKGNCIDNASMESFFGHFKDEIDISGCITINDAIDLLRYTSRGRSNDLSFCFN
jgi:putative transposase